MQLSVCDKFGLPILSDAGTVEVYVLAQRPDVENKIRDEVDTIMGERQEITLADVNQLRYVDAVVKEVLRLYPPIAQTVRSAVHDDVVCGVQIPAGVTLAIVPALLHRLPEYWERPDEFWPERWYDNTLRHNPAYIPFLSTSCSACAAGAGAGQCVYASQLTSSHLKFVCHPQLDLVHA